MSKSCECPYCRQKLTLRQCLEYFNKGQEHSVRCNGCGRNLYPKKNPYSPQRGVYWGMLSVWAPWIISQYVFHTDITTTIMIIIPFICVAIFLSIYIWYKNLYFE